MVVHDARPCRSHDHAEFTSPQMPFAMIEIRKTAHRARRFTGDITGLKNVFDSKTWPSYSVALGRFERTGCRARGRARCSCAR